MLLPSTTDCAPAPKDHFATTSAIRIAILPAVPIAGPTSTAVYSKSSRAGIVTHSSLIRPPLALLGLA